MDTPLSVGSFCRRLEIIRAASLMKALRSMRRSVIAERIDCDAAHRLVVPAASLLMLAALAGVAARLPFGVDLTDEAFYVALARRFAQGDRPFLDDWSALQLSGYALSPLVKIWSDLRGTEGIVLGFRCAYLVTKLLVLLAIHPHIVRVAGRPVALSLSAVFVALIPFLLPSLSYNTLAIAFLTVGISSGAAALKGSRMAALACGFGFAAASFVYPTLSLLGVVAFALLVFQAAARRAVWWAMAGAAPVVLALLWVLKGCWGGIPDTIKYLSAVGAYAGGTAKVLRVASGTVRLLGTQPAIWGSLLVVLLRYAAKRPLGWWVAPLLLAGCSFTIGVDPLYSSIVVAIQCIVVGLVILLVVRSAAVNREDIWTLVFGGLAPFSTAYSSSNAALGAGIGALGALVAVLTLVAGQVRRLTSAARYETSMLVACSVLVVSSLAVAHGAAYRDERPSRLVQRITSGPYAGMRTTQLRREHLQQVTFLIRARSGPENRLMAYPDFPVAYLLSESRAGSPMLWLSDVDAKPEVLPLVIERLSDPRRGTDLVIRSLDTAASGASIGRLDAWVQENFEHVASSPRVDIYALPEHH